MQRKWLYWTPRILAIIFICFLLLFSLDVFGQGLSFSQKILGRVSTLEPLPGFSPEMKNVLKRPIS